MLYNKCLRHSVNRIQTKNYRIRTYEIKKKKYSLMIKYIS